MSSRPGITEHPIVAPARFLFDFLTIETEPLALQLMGSGLPFLSPDTDSDDAFRVIDSAFDLCEANGFNCEQFRSVDAGQFWAAAVREDAVCGRRWKSVPMFAAYPEQDRDSGESVVVPVAVSDFTADSVRLTSVSRDERIPIEDLLGAPMTVWCYAAPVPSLQAILAPARYSIADRAAASLRVLVHWSRCAARGVAGIERFLADRPMDASVADYRRRMRAVALGNPTFFRAEFHRAAARYGEGVVTSMLVDGFERSADLHAQFLAGDDGALTEIARVERAALDRGIVTRSGRWV